MQNSRARSSSRASSSRNKPLLLTKYKERSGNHSLLDNSQVKHHSYSSNFRKSKDFQKMFLQRTARNKFPLDQSFPNTSKKLEEMNFDHHHPELCVCADCLCGRHYCKMHQVYPDLSKNSIYQKDFYRKCPIENKVNISKEYDKLQGDHLEMNSIYLKDFPGNKGDKVEKPHPEDLLKTGGPSQNLTSYSSGFPGYRCENQYVKPTDKYTREKFPLRARSTYTKSFVGEHKDKDELYGIPDNLKTGYKWLGDTTYGTRYYKPSSQHYPAHFRRNEKIDIIPDYKRQYETTYKNSYLGEKKEVCPAKTKLETKVKGMFTNSKAKFTENSDFKAFSPEFHAISTSKHSYV